MNYLRIWLVFVEINAHEGFDFNDLIEGSSPGRIYIGAWANILVKSETITEAIELLEGGLRELNFKIIFIDKIENFNSLVEYDEVDKEVITEADWLIKSTYKFKISDKIFPL
ncbi:MAG: hypothetical protein EOO43_04985 [Flavobacterium sp.]|nr:MAG: hypothetical protein EOO43_04985 [Flavobacterium sp.]